VVLFRKSDQNSTWIKLKTTLRSRTTLRPKTTLKSRTTLKSKSRTLKSRTTLTQWYLQQARCPLFKPSGSKIQMATSISNYNKPSCQNFGGRKKRTPSRLTNSSRGSTKWPPPTIGPTRWLSITLVSP